MEIIQANTSHISTIQDIALRSWEITYADILSQEQMNYMIDMMYSTQALKKQMTEQNQFFLLIKTDPLSDILGFISYEFNYKNQPKTKIHKLYLLPECKGKGMGRILIDKVATLAQTEGNSYLSLNMNRDNKSIGFYKQMGFEIVGEEDNDIGSGYLMEDYIFERKI